MRVGAVGGAGRAARALRARVGAVHAAHGADRARGRGRAGGLARRAGRVPARGPPARRARRAAGGALLRARLLRRVRAALTPAARRAAPPGTDVLNGGTQLKLCLNTTTNNMKIFNILFYHRIGIVPSTCRIYSITHLCTYATTGLIFHFKKLILIS